MASDEPVDPQLSAGVLLRGAGTRGAEPPEEQVERVRIRMSELGFDVTGAFAGTFSITGPQSLFTQVFSSASEELRQRGRPEAAGAEVELPVQDLASALGSEVEVVQAVFFSARPDFGPGNP